MYRDHLDMHNLNFSDNLTKGIIMKIKTLREQAVTLRDLCVLSALLVTVQVLPTDKPPLEDMVTKIMKSKIASPNITEHKKKFHECVEEFKKCVHKFMDPNNTMTRHKHIEGWRKVNAELHSQVIVPLENDLRMITERFECEQDEEVKKSLKRDISKLTVLVTSIKEIHEGIEKSCKIFLGHKGPLDMSGAKNMGQQLEQYKHLLPVKIRAINILTLGMLLITRFGYDKKTAA